mgnify:FL=1
MLVITRLWLTAIKWLGLFATLPMFLFKLAQVGLPATWPWYVIVAPVMVPTLLYVLLRFLMFLHTEHQRSAAIGDLERRARDAANRRRG